MFESKVLHLYLGEPKPLNNSLNNSPSSSTVMSSICRASSDKILVHLDSIEGDRVANEVHHGGLDRVLHHFPIQHYQALSLTFQIPDLGPGSIGENLSANTLSEKNVCIGDIYQIGPVKGIVTEPRKPCATINQRFGVKGLARTLQNECKTGWFYRILTPGPIQVNDSITLVSRQYPELTLEKCIQALLLQPEPKTLKLMIENPVLSQAWKKSAESLLKSGQLPDDRRRLGEIS